jgi:hypothetical protein
MLSDVVGYVTPCVSKRFISFDTLAVSQSQEIILADRIERLQWSEAIVMVRVYSHSLAGGSGTITIGTYPESFSAQDPGMQFLDRSFFQSVTINGATLNPAYLTFAASEGAMIVIVAQGARSAAGALNATVSIDVSFKDA